MGIGPTLSKSQAQGQVIKGHENQRSHLSSMTQVFGTILAIEIDEAFVLSSEVISGT